MTKTLFRLHSETMKARVFFENTLKGSLRDSEGKSLDKETFKVSLIDSEGQSLGQLTLKASLRESEV